MRALIVHGGVSGARTSPPPLRLAPRLRSIGVAIDAVEEAIRDLEEHQELNAGLGAVLNQAGDIELDAGIANGHTGTFGGVASVKVKHPISLARCVMEQTPHVLMSAPGAMLLARQKGFELLDSTTERQVQRWQEAAQNRGQFEFGAPEDVDTVGAVGLDEQGRLAAGSSSGGILGKLPGRVGDAPIYGAGVFANRRVAVVGTGVGESFIEMAACREVGEMVGDGVSPQDAVEKVIRSLAIRGAPAGLLALDRHGSSGAAFTGLSWAVEGFGSYPNVVRIEEHPAA